MRPFLLALLASLAWSLPWSPADAATPRIDCSKAVVTPELAFCAEIGLKRADGELNVVWRQALGVIEQTSEMDAATRAKWTAALRDSQRAWIAFRDADCGEPIGYEWFGGTGMSLATTTCLEEKTKARTADLRQRYLAR